MIVLTIQTLYINWTSIYTTYVLKWLPKNSNECFKENKDAFDRLQENIATSNIFKTRYLEEQKRKTFCF